ncbi:MAG: hypothetical protein KDF60_19935, partial [Calditrichaeota bacterium]|nr:hypothetical protein [Calditrichota bacterium]
IITLTVFTIREDKNGNLIIGLGPYDVGHVSEGILIFNKETHKFSKYDFAVQTSTDNIHGSVRSRNNQLYFVGDSGLIKLDEELKQAEFFRPEASNNDQDFHAFAISEDASGLLWIGSINNGLFSFNPLTNSFKQFLPQEKTGQIYNIYVAEDQILWLATNNGLLYYNPKNNYFFNYQPDKNNPFSINSNLVNTVIKDMAGSFWIGSYDGGINRLDQTGSVFRSYINDPTDDSSFGARGSWATQFTEDREGSIWIVTGQKFLNKFDRSKNTFSRVSLGNATFRTCFNDINNNLWVSTYDGDLFKYDFREKMFKKILTLPSDWGNTVTSILTDSFGNMWLGSFDRYYLYNSKTGKLTIYDYGSEKASGPSSDVNKIVEDQNHNIWICTNDGLFRRNLKNSEIKRIGLSDDPGKSFLNQDINSIYIGEDGIIWVGTWRGGLNSYNPVTENIKTYTRKNGLPSNSIQGILGDEKNGAIWVSTFQGISRFDIKTETFQNFDIKDGIQSNLFADGAALKTRNGDFLFGGSGGFTMFRPEGINESKVPPSVFLTELKLSDKTILPGAKSPLKKSIYDAKKINLEHDQNDITIEYMGIHFVKSFGTHYAYILENYEESWHKVGDSRKAIYPNLPPGDYTFKVKAANYNNVWNEHSANLRIKINPPLWATWWAYSIYVIFAFGFLYSVRKFELKRQWKNAEIKESKLRAEAAELQAKAAEAQSKVIQAENERKSKELEEARKLQLSMLPKELPKLPHLDIAVYMQTATEVGGDYYDFHVGLDGTLTVVIGDATGHGMQAGTM